MKGLNDYSTEKLERARNIIAAAERNDWRAALEFEEGELFNTESVDQKIQKLKIAFNENLISGIEREFNRESEEFKVLSTCKHKIGDLEKEVAQYHHCMTTIETRLANLVQTERETLKEKRTRLSSEEREKTKTITREESVYNAIKVLYIEAKDKSVFVTDLKSHYPGSHDEVKDIMHKGIVQSIDNIHNNRPYTAFVPKVTLREAPQAPQPEIKMEPKRTAYFYQLLTYVQPYVVKLKILIFVTILTLYKNYWSSMQKQPPQSPSQSPSSSRKSSFADANHNEKTPDLKLPSSPNNAIVKSMSPTIGG